MPDTAIHIDHVHKRFRLGTRSSYFRFSEIVQNAGVSVFRAPKRLLTSDKRANVTDAASTSELWALQDIDLTIPQGEVLGIIGRNGAGKSTLLKILSKITRPTQGRVGVRGRVGSLLEVGTGFHPELTGRENIYLNGSILGMTRQEVKAKFDEIVAFAEVERFLDTPVKRYSSGMYIRLAFAVAAHLEPEILLVDEVLAVGDTAFQKKCLGKMSDVSASGRTILYISHNMSSIVGMCTRAMLLEQGRMEDVGEPKSVVESYLSSVAGAGMVREWNTFDEAPGTDKLRLQKVAVLAGDDAQRLIDVSTPLDIETTYWNRSTSGEVAVCTHLYDMHGACAFMTVTPPQSLAPGLYRSRVHVPGDLLNNGWYTIHQLLVLDFQIQVDVPDVVSFEVHDTKRKIEWYNEWVGVVRPNLEWETERLE